MKNIIFLLFVSLIGFSVQAQKIQSSSYSTMYYINSDGRIQDNNYRTLGYIKDDKIQDNSYKTIGYIRDGKVQDNSYRTVGYIDKNGKVQDNSYRTLGYIDSNGKVQDNSYKTLGYASGVKREWVAVVFFFFQM